MAITGSPDVFVSEQDLSTYVGNMDVTTAGIAGDFVWGPAGEVVRVSDEARLKAIFGGPVDRNYKDWFTAKNYLEYSNSLSISRVVLDSSRNAYFIPQTDFIPVRTDEETDFPWTVPAGYADKVEDLITDEVSYQQYLLNIGEYAGKETTLEGIENEVTQAYNEKLFYTPITQNESVNMTEDAAIANATITNLPNYVAYTNKDGKYSVGKTTRQLFEDYGATPNNILDLIPLNAGFDDTGNAAAGNHIGPIASETLDNIGMCSVIACYNKPAEDEPKKYYYLRKKYLNKFYEIIEDPDVEEGKPKEYLIKFKQGQLKPDTDNAEALENWNKYGKYVIDGYGINWGYKNAEENGIYHAPFLDVNGVPVADGLETIKFYIEAGEFKLHVNNNSDYQTQIQDVGKNKVIAMAKYPGEYGNRIHVSIINKPAYDAYKKIEKFKRNISSLTSVTKNRVLDYLGNKELEEDSIAIAVFLWDEKFENLALKEYGIFSLTPGSLDITGYDNYVFNYFSSQSNYVNLTKGAFEALYGSDLTKAWINIDTDLSNGADYMTEFLGGNDALYSDVITTNSNGIDYDVASTATTIVTDAQFIKDYTPIINLVGGVGAYKKAWDLFRNEEADNTQVQLLMQGGGSPEIGQYIIDLAEKRKDCLACVSPALSECVNVTDPCDRIADGTGKFYSMSSYAYMDGNYKYQYDAVNDCYRWIPLNGDIAGLFAYIDAAEEPWMSIGGRQLRNCIKLAFYPSKADRDILFNAGVNAVTNFSSEGNVVWGDWTRLTNSAFNFVGVRRCFLHIERNIVQYARKIMWKQNDTITRDQFVLAITPFLDSIVGGRGLQEYGIYAGADVTSLDEMDRGIFRAKIVCKPVRSIRYVDLVFSAIRSDMSISEVVD